MTKDRKNLEKRNRRTKRIRSRLHGTAESPRLSFKRTLKHSEAQLINDDKQITLASVHDRELSAVKPKEGQTVNVAKAYALGELIAEKAKKHKIVSVVFDRRGSAYHGRVAAFAEGARKGGLKF